MVASVYSTSASVQLSNKKQCTNTEAMQHFRSSATVLCHCSRKTVASRICYCIKKVLINRLPNPKPSQASGDDNGARHLYFLASVTMGSKCFTNTKKFSSSTSVEERRYLQVGSNPLNGVLPNSIGNLSSTIEDFYIGDAHLNGLIPPSIGNMSALIILVFENNILMENIPPEIDLDRNDLTEVIPECLGNLSMLQHLYLGSNKFSSKLPLSLWKMKGLLFLNVSRNSIEGEIPPNIGLEAIADLDLSGNHLSGKVPACPVNNTGQQSKSMELVLKIVIPVVTSSFLIFLLASDWIMKWQKKQKLKDVEKVLEIGTYQLISYHEIQRATNNFDGSNLIGEGSSGSVYQGTLSSGNVVAIKVLDLENEQVCKSEYIIAFVLQYMSNGSLENWLYREDFHLNLLQRVTIMLDAAMTIEYLHHGNDTPIVHCDLKPANVLLDEDMVAHVGDFGISKILAVSKSMAHTETLGTLGYTVPGTMMDVIEDNLFPEEQITSKSEICIASMVELALDCTMEMPESRITMKDVVKRLNKIKNVFLET
ncbi:putative LRR receptor-like serine/threonine-protein kinase FLS2-like [Capsicum annuum]|nr:putative LRR receptor-like serine/threonine-protein kinase FLS2-like [Capsicum annuum]